MSEHSDARVGTPPRNDKSAGLRLPSQVDPAIAELLVEQAGAEGVDLVGPGGLLGDRTKRVLETSLEVELEDHLGYPNHGQ